MIWELENKAGEYIFYNQGFRSCRWMYTSDEKTHITNNGYGPTYSCTVIKGHCVLAVGRGK